MARPRSEFLSSLGLLFEIFKGVADAVLELGGSDEDIAKAGTNDQTTQDIARLIVGELPVLRKESRYGWTLEKVSNHQHATLFHVALYCNNSRNMRCFSLGDIVGTATCNGYITFLDLPEKEGEDPKISVLFSGAGGPVRVAPDELKY